MERLARNQVDTATEHFGELVLEGIDHETDAGAGTQPVQQIDIAERCRISPSHRTENRKFSETESGAHFLQARYVDRPASDFDTCCRHETIVACPRPIHSRRPRTRWQPAAISRPSAHRRQRQPE